MKIVNYPHPSLRHAARPVKAIDKKIHIPKDSEALVRTTSLLGEKFIELHPLGPPTQAPYLSNGDTVSRTKQAPDVVNRQLKLTPQRHVVRIAERSHLADVGGARHGIGENLALEGQIPFMRACGRLVGSEIAGAERAARDSARLADVQNGGCLWGDTALAASLL